MTQIKFEYPEKFNSLVNSTARYNIFHGGRGGAKTESIARIMVQESLTDPALTLCAREIQNSIKDSVHKVLVDVIQSHGLLPYFKITEASIKNIYGGEFVFKGLKNNIAEIKSMHKIKRCWVEEAENTSENSWDILDPTIRESGSKLIIGFNPKHKDSATYKRFVLNPPPDSIVTQVNYYDNPWFGEPLKSLMEYDKRTNYAKYCNKWLGQPEANSEAQIFKNKFRVESFEAPDKKFMFGGRFFFGADYGFSNDAATLIRSYIVGRKLYIDHEFYGVGVEIRNLASEYEKIPESRKGKIYGDSARPDTISHLKHYGFDIEGADKGKGSVEDGIAYLMNFEEIIIHPRCKNTIDEFNYYSYKVDKNSGEVLRDIVDEKNHTIDAIRYGHCKYIKRKVSILDSLPSR